MANEFKIKGGFQIGSDGQPISTISTDNTLAGNSDNTLSTQKAVKAYADTKVAAAANEKLTGYSTMSNAVAASVTIGDVVFTAKTAGTAGNIQQILYLQDAADLIERATDDVIVISSISKLTAKQIIDGVNALNDTFISASLKPLSNEV